MRKTGKKMVAVLLAVAMAVTFMPALGTAADGRIGAQTVYAADDEPAEVQDTYEYDGVTYVNVGDKNFSTNQTAYYKAMLGNKLDNNAVDANMRGYSISDLWSQLAFYVAHDNSRTDNVKYFFHYFDRIYEHPSFADARNLLVSPDTGELQGARYKVKFTDYGQGTDWNIPAVPMIHFPPNNAPTYWWRDTLKSAANGETMANAVARQSASCLGELRAQVDWDDYPININTVEIKNDDDTTLPDEKGPVFYTTLGTASDLYQYWYDRKNYQYHTIVVAFSDFNVTPIIPDENETNPSVYVISSSGESSTSNVQKTVSDVKNASSLSATASQSVSESNSSTLSSSISGSSSHAVAQTHKAGIKISPAFKFTDHFKLGGDVSYEYANTVTNTVSKGWSENKSVTTSDSKSSNISVTLPPYTAVLLSQKRSTETLTAEYNCPVALNFKVTVYYAYGEVDGTTKTKICFKKLAEFGGAQGGNSALEDLYERYDNYKVAGTADRGQINWSDMEKDCGDVIATASTTATFGSTPAKFTNVVDAVKTEVDSVLPIKPIYSIRPVNINEQSAITNQTWDCDIDMNDGDSEFIANKVKLKAMNDAGAEFSSFNQSKGHFIVIDENGNEDSSVVELIKVNGQKKFVAKKEGTAYLKYIIDDDVYQTADMAALNSDEYITNEDIANAGGTAVIQINVHHKHNMTRHASKDPTCTEDGNIAYWECTKDSCGRFFKDKDGEDEISEDEATVRKTGHKWSDWEVIIQPTETTEGKETRECLNGCGEVQTKSIPTTTHVHKLKRYARIKPTCTEDGNIAYWICEEGGNPCYKIFEDKNGEEEISMDETIDSATGHEWGDWKVKKAPTETAEGVETRSCTNKGCSETESRSIPVTAHTHKLIRHAAKDATCTESGNIIYWTCSEGENPCGKLFSDKDGENEISEDEAVTPAANHSWDKGVMTQAPSTTKDGTMKYTCKNCGEVMTKTIAKLKAANIYAKISSDKTSQRISWTKVSGADGYSVYFTPCTSNDTVGNYDLVKNVGSKTYSFTKKGLKKGKMYKSYVEAYKNVNGQKVVIAKSLPVHSITGNYNKSYTNPKSVATGKTKVTVKIGKTYKIKGNKITKYKKSRKVLKHENNAYRFESSNTKVIKGKSKGTCKVHVIANNGVEKIIKVTVK